MIELEENKHNLKALKNKIDKTLSRLIKEKKEKWPK